MQRKAFPVHKKINSTAEGDFEREFPLPSFEPEKIEESITEGTDVGGTLRIYSDAKKTLSGKVLSSNPYVTIEQSDFTGEDVRISYIAHLQGFYPGERLEGKFTVISDGYENTIPYAFTVEERPLILEGRKILSLSEFADAVEKDPSWALNVFSSDDFRKFITRHYPDLYLSYKALTATMGFTRLALESFLTENGLKESIRIHVFPDNLSYYSINEDIRESFRITRNTEGYIRLHFSLSDDSFIELQKTDATDTDFYGGTLEIPFYIRKSGLHEGINRTNLIISGNGIYITKTITASTYGRGEIVHAKHRERKQVIVKAVNSYLDFRLRKTDQNEFLQGAMEACEYFLNENPSDYFALCYRTMAQIVAGQRKQAVAAISMLKEMISDKNSFEWAFLLYLCTLIDPSDQYIDTITAEIEQIQEAHPEDARIFWFLLFLRKDYIDAPLSRLRDLRQRIIRGVDSPIFYVEACDMLNAYPYMIGQLDSFSLSILRFGIRRDVLGKQVVPCICECLYDLKTYSEAAFDFVTKLYDRFMDTDLLEAIVAYLLRTRCVGERFLIWYKRGIDAALNLTGLYESYIYSVSDSDADMLPRLLVMYFAYDNSLPDDRKEYLYSNIVMYKSQRQSVYELYLKQIERFAIEKLQNGEIDDNLAVIYSDLYKRGFFDKELLRSLKKLKNAMKIICMPQDSGELYIFTKEKINPVKVMLTGHYVVCDMTGDEFIPVLVSPDGVFFSKDDFHCEKMLPELSDSDDDQDDTSFEDRLIAIQGDDTDPVYRDLFFAKADEKELKDAVSVLPPEERLSAGLKGMQPKEAAYIISGLISAERMDEAYKALTEVNGLNVPDSQLLRLVTWECQKNEEDPFLISLSAYLFKNLLSNTDTLTYLCEYYDGPSDDMISLYRFANARDCDVTKLSEKIITQMIYEEKDEKAVTEIAFSYMESGGSELIIGAYLSYISDRYLRGVSDRPDSKFFKAIKNVLDRDDAANNSLKFAMLKYYSMTGTLSDDDYRLAVELLHNNLLNNIYFAFYKKLDLRLVIRSGLYEKTIIEYHDSPGQTLYFSYDADTSDQENEMAEVYDGIYTYTFLLFRGEKTEYKITDTQGNVRKESSVTNQDYLDEARDSRFGRLGNIYEDISEKKPELKKDLDDYLRLDISQKDLFSMV